MTAGPGRPQIWECPLCCQPASTERERAAHVAREHHHGVRRVLRLLDAASSAAGDAASRTLTSGQVAPAIGLKAATVQWYARQGRIPHDITPGGHYRFNLAEVIHALGRLRRNGERLTANAAITCDLPLTGSPCTAMSRFRIERAAPGFPGLESCEAHLPPLVAAAVGDPPATDALITVRWDE